MGCRSRRDRVGCTGGRVHSAGDVAGRARRRLADPCLRLAPVGIFGPIVSPPPTDEQAQRLLDVVLLVAQCPGFFEIKRGRAGKVQLGPRP